MSTATAVGLHSKRRRLIAILALVVSAAMAVALSTVFTQSKADAHGATVFPGSRQFFCYYDAIANGNGNVQPWNQACLDAANAAGGADGPGGTALWNWFAVLDSNGAGRTEGYIPDGEICNGANRGPYDFSGYNDPGPWPRTHVTAGETVQWRFNNWAHHPGDFNLYITKDGWNPNAPIAWDDLEELETFTDPDYNGGPGDENNYYYDTLTLPDKSGYHVIFTHWDRSDSDENFYACSDVEFDGGNGEVTGVHPDTNLPANDGGVIEPSDDPTSDEPSDDPSSDDPGDSDCTATAQVNSWGSGATVHITVTNTSDTNISDWMLHWMWEPNSGITITQSWSSEISGQGDMVMASPADWNDNINAGESVSFGFNVSGSLTEMPPMDCMPA